MNSSSDTKPICCPEFNPIPWDDQLFEWKDKRFIKDKVFTLFYMPMNFGKVMKRFDQKVTAAGATMPDWLCLSDHTSKWNMDLYLAVDKEVSGAENTTLTGKYYSKVYEDRFVIPKNGVKTLKVSLLLKVAPSKNGTCGIPPARSVPKST